MHFAVAHKWLIESSFASSPSNLHEAIERPPTETGEQQSLCHSSQDLCGCCEQPLVNRVYGPMESPTIRFEEALEVCEQHFDLLA